MRDRTAAVAIERDGETVVATIKTHPDCAGEGPDLPTALRSLADGLEAHDVIEAAVHRAIERARTRLA